MIQLFLDGTQVFPKENQSIKLTVENQYFTKSASYTYDVELPLDIPQNRRFFGFLNRIDVSKRQKKMEAALYLDNSKVLTGTAHITTVSESTVKVQLLGEEASYNYGNKMDETYIDSLDLGDWFMTTWPDGSYYDYKTGEWKNYPPDSHFTGDTTIVFERLMYDDTGKEYIGNIISRIYDGRLSWVAYPVINTTTGITCNEYCYTCSNDANPKFYPSWRNVGFSDETGGHRIRSSSVQPFVWLMAEKIAGATGFTLEREDNALYTNEFFRRIFIVNANNMIECNKCLPHWSVNEWWTQVEDTFGVVMKVDYAGKRMYLRQRSEHYITGTEKICLKNVVDEYTVEIDDETQQGISVNNVGYSDFEADPADLLDEYITVNCIENKDFKSIDDLLSWGKRQGIMSEYKGTLFICADGREFIYTEAEGFVEVNQFRPRIIDAEKKDIDIELKFVPAMIVDGEGNFYGYHDNIPGYLKKMGTFAIKILQVQDISGIQWGRPNTKRGNIDIESILNESEDENTEEGSSMDIIPIAILCTENNPSEMIEMNFKDGRKYSGLFWYPRAQIRERVKAGIKATSPATENPIYSLSLIPVAGQKNLAAYTYGNTMKVDAKTRYCIRFISDSIPDPSSIFIIRNRRYLCEKIEADMETSGLKKMMTGYFYEFEL